MRTYRENGSELSIASFSYALLSVMILSPAHRVQHLFLSEESGPSPAPTLFQAAEAPPMPSCPKLSLRFCWP